MYVGVTGASEVFFFLQCLSIESTERYLGTISSLLGRFKRASPKRWSRRPCRFIYLNDVTHHSFTPKHHSTQNWQNVSAPPPKFHFSLIWNLVTINSDNHRYSLRICLSTNNPITGISSTNSCDPNPCFYKSVSWRTLNKMRKKI